VSPARPAVAASNPKTSIRHGGVALHKRLIFNDPFKREEPVNGIFFALSPSQETRTRRMSLDKAAINVETSGAVLLGNGLEESLRF